jgi:hypothetical protein
MKLIRFVDFQNFGRLELQFDEVVVTAFLLFDRIGEGFFFSVFFFGNLRAVDQRGQPLLSPDPF